MHSNGFYFTIEAMLSIFLIALLITLLPFNTDNSLKEAVIMQKAFDLLKVWNYKHEFRMQELKKDFEIVFSGFNGIIEVDGMQLTIGEDNEKKGLKALSVSGVLGSEGFKLRRVKIVVFY